jgi:hypothetical protein
VVTHLVQPLEHAVDLGALALFGRAHGLLDGRGRGAALLERPEIEHLDDLPGITRVVQHDLVFGIFDEDLAPERDARLQRRRAREIRGCRLRETGRSQRQKAQQQ